MSDQQTKTLLQQLKEHDWYFCYSDDHSVYERGRRNKLRLIRLLSDNGYDVNPIDWMSIGEAIGRVSNKENPLDPKERERILARINAADDKP